MSYRRPSLLNRYDALDYCWGMIIAGHPGILRVIGGSTITNGKHMPLALHPQISIHFEHPPMDFATS